MNNQINILIIILAIGFFMLPDSIYACGTKSEKLCCKQETASKTEKKDCCKNKQSKIKIIVVKENADIQTVHHLQ